MDNPVYEIIQTGSKGNAVILCGKILVDCGVPYYKLQPYLQQIRLVLLTHIHGDHFVESTVRRIAMERPLIRFACGEWMLPELISAYVRPDFIDVLKPNTWYSYGNLSDTMRVRIKTHALVHDVPNFGYSVIWEGTKIFYATDTGTLEGITAKNYDYYLVEANHGREEIEQRAAEKMAAGQYAYEIRAAANHMSVEDTLDWLYANMGPNSQYVMLHQHEERKDEENV